MKGQTKTFFLHPEHWKKRLGRSCLSDDLCRRMALKTHNYSSGRLKKRHWPVRLSDVWRCRKAMRTHFLHPGQQKKKRLERNRLRDVSNRRMGLRTHNLPSVRHRIRSWWSRWSDVSRSPKAIKTHFLHPQHRKNRQGWIPLSNVLNRSMELRSNNMPS
jgi:hypothetical protein